MSTFNNIRGRRFGLAGFDAAESSRISEALAERGAFSRTLRQSLEPTSPEIQNAEALIIESSLASGFCAKHGTSSLNTLDRPVGVVGTFEPAQDGCFVRVLPNLRGNLLIAEVEAWLTDSDCRLSTGAESEQLLAAKHRILIADDDESMRELIGQVLKRPTVDWREAPDGRQALSLAKLVMPDLLILDLNMPGLNGFGVLSEIRKDPGTRSAAVMLVTGRHSTQDIRMAADFGADMYVVKPFKINDFRTRVQSLLWKNQN